MAEVDHLGALRLEDAAHDVDRGIVAVEQAGGRDEAHRVDGNVEGIPFNHVGNITRRSYYLST
jgi:hypothetical protein